MSIVCLLFCPNLVKGISSILPYQKFCLKCKGHRVCLLYVWEFYYQHDYTSTCCTLYDLAHQIEDLFQYFQVDIKADYGDHNTTITNKDDNTPITAETLPTIKVVKVKCVEISPLIHIPGLPWESLNSICMCQELLHFV